MRMLPMLALSDPDGMSLYVSLLQAAVVQGPPAFPAAAGHRLWTEPGQGVRSIVIYHYQVRG